MHDVQTALTFATNNRSKLICIPSDRMLSTNDSWAQATATMSNTESSSKLDGHSQHNDIGLCWVEQKVIDERDQHQLFTSRWNVVGPCTRHLQGGRTRAETGAALDDKPVIAEAITQFTWSWLESIQTERRHVFLARNVCRWFGRNLRDNDVWSPWQALSGCQGMS